MIDGEIIFSRRIPEGVSGIEGRELESKLRLAIGPEIQRIVDLGFDKTAAEGIIILECLKGCGQAKKYLRNNAAATIFTATALGVVLQSEDPSLIMEVTYEVSDKKKPGTEGYFDILNIKMEGQKKDANIPVPVINPSVLGYLAKKIEVVAFKPNYKHDRKFSDTPSEIASNADSVAAALLDLDKTVDLESVCRTILNDYYDGNISFLIKKIKETSGEWMTKEGFVKLLIDWENTQSKRPFKVRRPYQYGGARKVLKKPYPSSKKHPNW